MYKVDFREKSSDSIDWFINWYLGNFLELFTDTWLYEEETIKNTYIDNSLKFQKNIYDSVENLLSEENILWYNILENNDFEITTIVWNYRLFIEYWEDNNEKLRFIENIRFFNK